MTKHAAELRIIAQDPQLPGLALLLDNDALLQALRCLPPLQDAQFVTLDYLRYKPGNSCAASLTVTLGSQQRKTYFAKALTAERFIQSWQHPKRQALIAAGDPDAPLALHASAILLQHPLHDRTLRFLHLLKHDETRQALFRQLLPSFNEVEHIDWRFLRYKPERRTIIQLSCQNKPIAILRCACAKEYGRMLQGTAVGAALGHISLLGSLGNQRMLATRWIAGESLGPEHSGTLSLSAMEAAGSALAQVHCTPFSLPKASGSNENIQALWRVLNILTVIHPSGAVRYHELATKIAQYLMACRIEPVLIHGDFSADQVVKPADGGALHIIDWDRCTYGAPLMDLASFQARLELQAIDKTLQYPSVDSVMNAFLSGYSVTRTSPVDKQALAWYAAWALMCLATEPFRTRAEDWPEQIEALLDRVQQLLAQPTSTVFLPAEKLLVQLSTPSIMAQPLIAALNLPPQSRLQACRIVRHKPGRRAIIHYQIADPDHRQPHEVLGKYSKKGVNRAAFDYQKRLWRQGWHGAAPFTVPEPLALLPEWNIWLQRKVDAVALTELLIPSEPRLAELGTQVGKALAALHQHRGLQLAVAAKTWRIADELAVLQQGLHKVAALYPHWQIRLDRLLRACEHASLPLNREKTSCVHRDFYPDQVLINNQHPLRLTLLDFDLCCTSSPALDAGNYLAHVRELALRRYGDIHALDSHEQAFTTAFLTDSPEVAPRSIMTFTTLALTRHIFLSTQFTERHHTTATLIALCEQALAKELKQE
ncbi:aminoglycoside phosphotransferase family protein [Serratia silvae]|uniref:Phosphotransferase n=1 Tax=Serratia silvae TaxID=2824122 RepID=A0ABT0KAB9_9GAMM|nr:aminoglycoside phosphotransferase family protein [Serratia silvae]MCL1028968.1 phosphotransferase [Serratia silvae]